MKLYLPGIIYFTLIILHHICIEFFLKLNAKHCFSVNCLYDKLTCTLSPVHDIIKYRSFRKWKRVDPTQIHCNSFENKITRNRLFVESVCIWALRQQSVVMDTISIKIFSCYRCIRFWMKWKISTPERKYVRSTIDLHHIANWVWNQVWIHCKLLFVPNTIVKN